MRCPNKSCGRETDRTISRFDEDGKLLMEGCPSCFRHRTRGHIHTGRKIWTGPEAYGDKKDTEMNYEFLDRMSTRAAKMRREAHHSGFRR